MISSLHRFQHRIRTNSSNADRGSRPYSSSVVPIARRQGKGVAAAEPVLDQQWMHGAYLCFRQCFPIYLKLDKVIVGQ